MSAAESSSSSSSSCFVLHVFWEAPNLQAATAVLAGLKECAKATRRDTPQGVPTYFFRLTGDDTLQLSPRITSTVSDHPDLVAAVQKIKRGVPALAVHADLQRKGLDPALLRLVLDPADNDNHPSAAVDSTPVVLEFTEVYNDECAFMEHSASRDFLEGYAKIMNPSNRKGRPMTLRFGTPAQGIINLILQPVLNEVVCPLVEGCTIWRKPTEVPTASVFVTLDFFCDGATAQVVAALPSAFREHCTTCIAFVHPIHAHTVRVMAVFPELPEQSLWIDISELQPLFGEVYVESCDKLSDSGILASVIRESLAEAGLVETVLVNANECTGFILNHRSAVGQQGRGANYECDSSPDELETADDEEASDGEESVNTDQCDKDQQRSQVTIEEDDLEADLEADAEVGVVEEVEVEAAEDDESFDDTDDTEPSPYFTLEGHDASDIVFSFPEIKPDPSDATAESQLLVPLRAVVRSFTSLKLASKISAKLLRYVYGRLAWFTYLLREYNDGVDLLQLPQSPTEAGAVDDAYHSRFIRYQLVQALSGLGYQIKDTATKVFVRGMPELMRKLRWLYRDDRLFYRSCIQDGVIVFDALQELYQPGTIVRGVTSLGVPAGFRVVQGYYQERKTLFGFEQTFHLELQFVATLGADFAVVQFESVISRWMGEATRKISELFYAPADFRLVRKLATAGANYVALSQGGAKYLRHDAGSILLSSRQRSPSMIPASGRIMIDVAKGSALGHHAAQGADDASYALSDMTGRYKRFKTEQRALKGDDGGDGGSHSDAIFIIATVPSRLLAVCWPALVGFSFTTKSWCTCLVSGLKPIEFNDSAFDQLVLDPMRKRLIRALVRFGGGERQLEDIIEGKSGGSIFLLHGPAGVGKTLTAEAIAEVMHKPLYYVTMGELGTDPSTMETRLGEILALCSGWGALALIDEADVFLEKRASSDVVRNAMTCVMLRLLEYHPGILFLTTNRVTEFDPALESRITVALRYHELNEAARAQVWRNMIARVQQCPVGAIDYDVLGKYQLNGRQIKNSVRLALALALDSQKPLDMECIDETVAFTNLGRQDMMSSSKW